MTNLTTFPMPTNAGPKPIIKASGVAAADALAPVGTQVNTGNLSYITGSNPSAIEGKTVFGIFRFNADSTPGSSLSELKDSVSLKLSFDGISDLDWVPGTFKVAALGSNGTILSDIPSNFPDETFPASPVLDETTTGGWALVNSLDNAATTGMLHLKDMYPFNPFTGTGVYGLVLSVQTKTDALMESGEFVKFKIEQGTASGTAFTQSNYTEATIGVKDNVGGTNNAGVNVLQNVNFDVGNAYPLLNLAHAATVVGTNDVVDTFNIGVTAGAGGFSSSLWPVGPAPQGNWTTFYGINNFDREDVLKIDFKTFKPGLSITTVDAASAGIANEAYLLNTLRAIDGYQVNNSGIYLFEVANSRGYQFNDGNALTTNDDDASVTADGSVPGNLAGVSTYVYVDTNQNGRVDSNDNSGGDLLIRLAGVSVGDIQSTNFSFMV